MGHYRTCTERLKNERWKARSHAINPFLTSLLWKFSVASETIIIYVMLSFGDFLADT